MAEHLSVIPGHIACAIVTGDEVTHQENTEGLCSQTLMPDLSYKSCWTMSCEHRARKEGFDGGLGATQTASEA